MFDTVLPPLCPGCSEELRGRRWICGACRRRFEPVPAGPACLACRAERRAEGDRRAGFACRDPEHACYRTRAAYWLEDPLDRVVHALKYQGRPDLARPLGALLAARVRDLQAGGVTSVPLHRTRRRERGYNQASLLARAAADGWGIPWVEGVLVRTRSTSPQARTPEEKRGGNVAGAFAVAAPAWVRGRSWVLVDDVATTGSTLLEGAKALERGEASGVLSVTLALA